MAGWGVQEEGDRLQRLSTGVIDYLTRLVYSKMCGEGVANRIWNGSSTV